MALRLNYDGNYSFPIHTAEAIENYLFQGLEPGSFVSSVLCNDLVGACTRCDHINATHIVQITKFVLHCMPPGSWGNWDRMLKWMSDDNSIRSNYVNEFEKRLMWETLSQKEQTW
jgi:hypothetical protein